LENLEFATRSVVVRNVNKTENKFGYKGVIKSGNKFKAVLFNNRVRLDLGSFNTAAEASAAYKKKTAELFGKGKK
jgi:phosphotransferase system IIB component